MSSTSERIVVSLFFAPMPLSSQRCTYMESGSMTPYRSPVRTTRKPRFLRQKAALAETSRARRMGLA